MYKMIQRSGLFFASMIFSLVIGITSAHADDAGYSAEASYICHRKTETNEICYYEESDDGLVEICEKEGSTSLKCIRIED